MSRRRYLSDEERALWSGYARSITPLRRWTESDTSPNNKSPRDESSNKATERPDPPGKSVPLPSSSRGVRLNPEPGPAKPLPLAPLGRRLKQRVARGREPIDARIDLHGMTQLEAHAALLRFLRQARVQGARMALIVTGKGSRDNAEFGSGRGILKRQVPMWLSLPEFRQLIVGFEDAHIGHGGQGALYVRLRRER
jgi:DNA-nicking Smr family endonuclease